MTTLKKGLAEKALKENLDRHVSLKNDPKDYNLHIALLQMTLQLDEILDEQVRTRKLLERVAGAVLR